MTTMGVTLYCNRLQIPASDREQLVLLRTLQDNESNILGKKQMIAPKGVLVSNSSSSLPINSAVVLNGSSVNSGATSVVNQQVTNVLPPYDPTRLKKHGKNGQPPPVAVARRNARERNRVKQVNNGFATLRSHIPSHVAAGYGDRGKKLSKVETLRMAVEYIRGLQRMLVEADGLEFDPNRGMEQGMPAAPSPTGSMLSSSTHNGSGDRLVLEDEHPQEEEMDGEYLLEEDDEDEEDEEEKERRAQRNSLSIRLSPNLRTSSTSSLIAKRKRNTPNDYYSPSVGDEENVEPKDSRGTFSRFSPSSVASPVVVKNEFCGQSEDNLQTRVILSPPYSVATEISSEVINSEEASTTSVIYSTSPDTYTGPLYYKHEITESGEFGDIVSWWEQEQGRLVVHPGTQPHAQRLTHV